MHINEPWFDQECSGLANKRKQTRLLWLKNPSDQTAEDLTNIRCENLRPFKKNKLDYMEAKVDKLEETVRTKNIWEMYKSTNEFKKEYQPRTYVINTDDGIIVVYS